MSRYFHGVKTIWDSSQKKGIFSGLIWSMEKKGAHNSFFWNLSHGHVIDHVTWHPLLVVQNPFSDVFSQSCDIPTVMWQGKKRPKILFLYIFPRSGDLSHDNHQNFYFWLLSHDHVTGHVTSFSTQSKSIFSFFPRSCDDICSIMWFVMWCHVVSCGMSCDFIMWLLSLHMVTTKLGLIMSANSHVTRHVTCHVTHFILCIRPYYA